MGSRGAHSVRFAHCTDILADWYLSGTISEAAKQTAVDTVGGFSLPVAGQAATGVDSRKWTLAGREGNATTATASAGRTTHNATPAEDLSDGSAVR